jgi:hypothetical protein
VCRRKDFRFYACLSHVAAALPNRAHPASNAIADPSVPKETCQSGIPGFKDIAVKDYGEWLASTVSVAEWDGRTLMLIGGYGVPPKRFPVLRLSFSCRCCSSK